MEIKRTALWIIFIVSLALLFDNWQRFNGHPSMFSPAPPATTFTKTNSQLLDSTHSDLPDAPATSATPLALAENAKSASEKIRIKTDVFDGDIDTLGGSLTRLSLIKTNSGRQADLAITLFDQTANHHYLARSGLIGGDFPNHHTLFTVAEGPRTLADDAQTLTITLQSPIIGQIRLTKTFTFTRGSFVIGVNQKIENLGPTPIVPTAYMELVRDDTPVETPRFSHTFIGPAVYTNIEHFQKISFSDIDKNKASYVSRSDNGWIAMVQHYFASAWIVKPGIQRDIYVGKVNNLYRIGYKIPVEQIAPNHSKIISAQLFAGPEEERMLAAIAPGLELVKDYGWVTIIAKPLFWLLEKLHSYLGNWGWAIVALTFLIKAVFFPLSAASYRSMARMKEVTPRLQKIREQLKDDPPKLNAAMMELYKKEKINPLGGCLPVLVQIPVFISLYWVLLSSVEMRGAPWIFWLKDLSQQDPWFILPVLMTLSMFIQTKLNPTPPDPLQAKMMLFLPLVFSVMFFFFPSGLVLYYVVNNILSIIQQWYITRVMHSHQK